MEARAKIEEDLFTRVPLSKTERRRAKATTRSMNSLQNVGDFGDDVADLVEVAEELEGQRGKRQRLVDSVTLASGSEARKNQKPVSGEQDVPLRDSLGVRVPLFFLFPSPFPRVFFRAAAFLISFRFSLFASFEASMTVPRGHSASKTMPYGHTRSPKFGGRGESPPPAPTRADARRRRRTSPNIALSFARDFSIASRILNRVSDPSRTSPSSSPRIRSRHRRTAATSTSAA